MKQSVKIPTSLYLKVLSSLPQSSSLREGCRGQPGPPSVSLQSQGLRHKFPTSTAKSPLRSDHSLHLWWKNTQCLKTVHWFSTFMSFSTSSDVPCFSCICPPFITPILLLSMGPGGSGKRKVQKYLVKRERWELECAATHRTIVFALHKALPLSEPLHADTQDHCWSLLSLKLFVQLHTREKKSSFNTKTL